MAFTIASPLDMPFSSKEKIGLQCSRKFPRQFWSPGEDLGNNAVQIEDGDSPGTFEGYIAALFRPKRRADELAWRAAARRLGVRLIAAIHEPSKCDQIISYWQPGNLDASVQIIWLRKVVTKSWWSPSQVSNFPKNCPKWLLTLKKVAEWPLRVVEPRVKFQALLANPGYLAVLTKRGFLGLPRLAPSKLLLRLGLGLPPAWCSARPLLSLSKGLRLAEIILLAVALDLSLALAKALRPCKVNSGLFTGCVMFATRRFRAPLSGTCCMVLFAWACGFSLISSIMLGKY